MFKNVANCKTINFYHKNVLIRNGPWSTVYALQFEDNEMVNWRRDLILVGGVVVVAVATGVCVGWFCVRCGDCFRRSLCIADRLMCGIGDGVVAGLMVAVEVGILENWVQLLTRLKGTLPCENNRTGYIGFEQAGRLFVWCKEVEIWCEAWVVVRRLLQDLWVNHRFRVMVDDGLLRGQFVSDGWLNL